MKFLVVTIISVIALLMVDVALATDKCPPTQPPATTQPSGPRCPAGTGPYGGKDGDESSPYHNQECCPDADGNQRCDDVVRPGQVTVNTVRHALYTYVR